MTFRKLSTTTNREWQLWNMCTCLVTHIPVKKEKFIPFSHTESCAASTRTTSSDDKGFDVGAVQSEWEISGNKPFLRIINILWKWSFVYYESIKRELNKRLIFECRCDARLKAKTEGSTHLAYTRWLTTGGMHSQNKHDRHTDGRFRLLQDKSPRDGRGS